MIDPQDVAAARVALGARLAVFRVAASQTQKTLAKKINYHRSSVANVETGRQNVPRQFWVACDRALGTGTALAHEYDELEALISQRRKEEATVAGHANPVRLHRITGSDSHRCTSCSVPATDPADTVDDVKRRSALALPVLSMVAALGRPYEPWRRLAHALQHPDQLDEPTLEHLEWCTVELFRCEEHMASRQLGAHLLSHLDQLECLLTRTPDIFHARLLAITGEALALAGWVAWDSKDVARAHEMYERATEAARLAGDGPLHACVLAYRSYQAEADGDLPTARQLLAEAQRFVRSEGSATTRAWLAAREAEIDAMLGEETAALRALDRAITAYDYAHPNRERSWTAFFTPSRLGSMAVTTYARLDHPELDTTTDSVVASLPSTDAKTKAVILADVATAAIQRGRHERGAEFGHDALDQTLAREASLGRNRLHALHLMIRDKRDVPVLAELDDRLLAHVA